VERSDYVFWYSELKTEKSGLAADLVMWNRELVQVEMKRIYSRRKGNSGGIVHSEVVKYVP
jgi:hypothetical protein